MQYGVSYPGSLIQTLSHSFEEMLIFSKAVREIWDRNPGFEAVQCMYMGGYIIYGIS